MADLKITQLNENTDPQGDVLIPVVSDPNGTPVTEYSTKNNFFLTERRLTTHTTENSPTPTGSALKNELRLTAQTANTTIGAPSSPAVGNLLAIFVTAADDIDVNFNAAFDQATVQLLNSEEYSQLFRYNGTDWKPLTDPLIQ